MTTKEKSGGQNNAFLEGPIAKTLLLTSLAMIPGTLAMSMYNLVDTYFVSRLGDDALAAMGYCFPIIMIVNCIYHGLSTGIMTLLSHAIGRHDEKDKARILGLGILLVSLCAVVIGFAGALVIKPICAHLVETEHVLELTNQFMSIWFLGNITIALGLMSNKLLLALGHTKAASFWMVAGIVINAILEPIFIFGIGPVPRLEMYGAALATVIAQAITPIGSLYIVQKHSPFLNKIGFDFSHLADCWKRLIKFSLPATMSILVMPLGGLIMTWISSHFGDTAVAGIGAAQRLETLAFIIPMSLGVSLSPMIAQNYAAKNYTRVRDIQNFSLKFAFVFLMIAAVIMTVFASSLVGIFAEKPETLAVGARCLQIVAWSFAAQEMFRFCTFIYNSCNRPGKSVLFNIFRMFCLAIPLSMLALWYEDVDWIFIAGVIGDNIGAIIILFMTRKLVAGFIRHNGDPEMNKELLS